jgi:hypothetical protein
LVAEIEINAEYYAEHLKEIRPGTAVGPREEE